jgi:diguanylate cyclase (GGDEF)-like protein/PAS domain S-box-containing protein
MDDSQEHLDERVGQPAAGERTADSAALPLDSAVLERVFDRLPISLTVQDQNGRFILANRTAATNLGIAREALIGASPADFLAPAEATDRRQWELELVRAGRMERTEEKVSTGAGEQTWLTWHQPLAAPEGNLIVTGALDITERKQLEDALLRRVNFDDLTGLPNRILIREHVDRILRDKERRFALAFIDLDNFKHINDYYSHAIGDALLLKISRRIVRRLRETDMLARISGDEFLLLIDPITDNAEIGAIVGQILDDLKQPFQIETFEVFTSASIGVSVHPEHGLTYEELRRNADSAMYRAKSEAKGDAVYFNLKMGRAVTARMELEQRLRLAIRDRKFCCAFQPKVDIRGQAVVGFETLVRWRDDEGEIHPPSSFIGLAIELGLIDTITRFVLAEALRSIAILDRDFGPETTISLNVAAKQANDLAFMRSLTDMLEASTVAPRLMLELTEDAFVAKSQFQHQVLPRLRAIGVRVSIDDFGTGYSSLSALADITADELKVDRSFVASIHERPRSQSVLRAIESLGHALGMSIVAEGVETFEELAYLQASTRIRHAQGYYFAKPFFLDEADGLRRAGFGAAAQRGRGQSELGHSERGIELARPHPQERGASEARAAGAGRSGRG